MVRAIDFETTGLAGKGIEIGLIGNDIKWTSFIKVDEVIEAGAQAVHGITQAMIDASGITEGWVAMKLLTVLKDGDVLVAHNAPFDRKRIEGIFARVGKAMPKVEWVDTYPLAKKLVPGLPSYSLANLCKHFSITAGGHRALSDADACLKLYKILITNAATKASEYIIVNTDGSIVFGAWYNKVGMDSEYKQFEVRSVDFKTERFIAWDIVKNAMREYRFDRFAAPMMVSAIVAVVA